MVQRKVPSKLGIKPRLLKSDTQLVANLRPSSPQPHPHEKLKKIMKKSRPNTMPPFRKKRTQPLHEASTSPSPQKQSPNYMKSTSCFEARKDRSPGATSTSRKTRTPKASEKSKMHGLASGQKGSRTSSSKVVRTLTKTPSFKPSRPSKKCSSVILCEDLDAQRATCSSTLKDTKFPKYLELSPGGTELEGTSAMKVCPYNYCSLNGHHHAPVPPLRCFLSARRRALKTQKSFKLGCLSPRHTKPVEKKNEETVRGQAIFEAPEEVDMEATPTTPLLEEESRDFFIEIYSKEREGKDGQDLECSDIDWEEGYSSVPSLDDGQTLKSHEIDGDVKEEQTRKTVVESLYSELQDLYDEESVSSGAWSEENGDSESDISYHEREDQDFLNYDAFEVSSTSTEQDVNTKTDEDKITSIADELQATNACKNTGFEEEKDELQSLNLPIGDRNIKCSINYQREETSQESETVPDFAENSQNETNKRPTTIIYNIIQFNISVFVNGEKTEHSETEKGVTVQVPTTAVAANKMGIEEVNEEQCRSDEDDANNLTVSDEISKTNQTGVDEEIPFHSQESPSNEQPNANEPEKKRNGCFEDDKHSESQVTEQGTHDVEEIKEEPASRSDEKQTDSTGERASKTDATNSSLCNKRASNELPDQSINLRWSTQGKNLNQETEDSKEFNPRGPNFLPEVPDPDAETVDLRHQMMDERKNAEEWMVDFALQQAVTTLAPERKRKVALLVEAFEKVMPIPKYEPHNRHTSKAFTNARPMQACS